MLMDMPVFVNDFSDGFSVYPLIPYPYCYDLKLFFNFLIDNIDEFKGKEIKDLTYQT